MATKLTSTVKAKGTVEVEVELTHAELSYCLMRIVMERIGIDDDAGCDWLTSWDKDDFGAYIGGKEWKVSNDDNVMILIDAANVLHYGQPLNIE